MKPTGAPTFTVYEGIGWRAYHGMSVLSVNGRSLDGRWFGAEPEIIVDLRGEGIDEAIKDIATAARDYPHADEYRVWPGPNSNSLTYPIVRGASSLYLCVCLHMFVREL